MYVPNSHAVRMVKFARDAQLRMTRLLDELQRALGEDTKDLVMRVGLHSGPVTVRHFLQKSSFGCTTRLVPSPWSLIFNYMFLLWFPLGWRPSW